MSLPLKRRLKQARRPLMFQVTIRIPPRPSPRETSVCCL